jgi:hypothetical protein
MFRGWGLDFIVAVDDDRQGREVYKNLKRELFGGDDDAASSKLVKLKPFKAIEDIFAEADFLKYVIRDESQRVSGSNGEFLKQTRRSKPIIACQFKLGVEKGEITLDLFCHETRENIESVVGMITDRLS